MTKTRLLVERNNRRKEIRSKAVCFITCCVLGLIGTVPFAIRVSAEQKETYIDKRYVEYCEKLGNQYAVSPEVLEALIEFESSGKYDAVSVHGAVGLTQIIPRYSEYSMTELLDPYTSIKACSEILLEYCEEYGDMGLALVAYNCGQYSDTFRRCERTGSYTKYAEKILNRAYELEDVHGKHSY